jgi:hypothetical protein
MPRGRPSVLTKTLQAKIAKCFFVAFTDEQTAEFCGVDQKTIQRIRREGRFCPAVKRAELAREMKYRLRVWNGVSNWQGVAWFLERKYPTQFAKPEVQLAFNAGDTITNNVVTVQIEQALKLKDLALRARDNTLALFEARNGNGVRDIE